MRPDAGVVLGGRYRLTRRIAVGGMGEVWVAHDQSLERDVAVKVLREEFAGDAGFLARFRTEARNAGSLSHPGIAALYDYGEQQGSAFLAMELIIGDPMSDILDKDPVMPPRTLLPILSQAARALHVAHQAGVVHRDVKPGNIMITPTGKVKLTDFGVSMASNQVPMTATGMVMGTAQYLSPEQAVGGPASAASDMYALGIIAYEATAGKRPFTGATAVDIAVAHVNQAVPPLPAQVDPALARLIMRLLAKDPVERPATAEELADLLDALVPRTPAAGMPSLPGSDAPRPAAIPVGGRPRSERGRPSADGATRVRGQAATPNPMTADQPLPPAFDPRTGRPLGQHTPPRGSGPVNRPHARIPRSRLDRMQVRWPLLALAVLVVALLGAALADKIVGSADRFPLDHDLSTTSVGRVLAAGDNDMMRERVSGFGPDAQTTTVKDA
ncbi:serine/threonine-protein kinase [Cellulomonas taurus]|uniref:serine/threonine-protein kinase n=1 Tax=Cellulomonas taurus TaxID=2729175 RepID=UPI00145E9406|nr:serine/threonine-protein kinase [Cellulomonas taurus]